MIPSLLVRNSDTACHKHSAAHLTTSGGIAFVHAYHDDFWNAFLHVISMPVYVHTLMVMPLVAFTHPFLGIETTRDIFSFFILCAYLPVDSWGAIFYALFVHQVFSWGIYFELYRSFEYGLLVSVLGAAEITITQVAIGHHMFQGYNAAFEIREAYCYTPFYFILRFLSWFGYKGHDEELHTSPPPHDTPIGEMGVSRGKQTVHNWCRNSSATVDGIYFPSSLNDLVSLVNQARASRKKIRAIGKGHTFNKTALVDDGQLLVRNDWLQGIKVVPESRRAFIQPGVTVDMLDQALSKYGLCVPTNVVLKTVTWGGTTQTGSHGSGHVPVCDMVQSLTIVDGTGRVTKLHRNDKDRSDDFQAAVQGLGTCGLLYELEIAVEPIKTLHMTNRVIDSYPTAKQIKELYKSNDQFEVFVNDEGKAVLRTWNQTQMRSPSWWDSFKYTMGSTMCHMAAPFVTFMGKSFAGWSSLVHLANPLFDRVGKTHESIHFLERIQDIPILSAEFCLRLQDMDEALDILSEMLEEYKTKGIVTALMVGEIRATPRSDTLLFAGSGSDDADVAWFEIVGMQCDSFREFSSDFSNRVMRKFPHTFPHWAKDITVIPLNQLKRRTKEVMGSKLERFNAVRRKMDPDGLFLNEFLESVLCQK